METKICYKCGEEKLLTEFYISKSNNKPISYCISCDREYKKVYRENNKFKIKLSKSKWYLNNKETNKIKSKENYIKNIEREKNRSKNYIKNNKEKIKIVKQEYYIKNKDKIIKQHNEYLKIRKNNDDLFKLKVNIRTNIYNNLKNKNVVKLENTNTILGCTYNELKLYLESKFESWMTWDNYGLYNGEHNYGWDIDHITPTSSANTEEELLNLNHYTNLQPLCSYTNRHIKKDNY